MQSLPKPIYRIWQLLRALTAKLNAAEIAFVQQLLAPEYVALFTRMPRYDQRHCLDVCVTLLRAGHSDLALLRAALLHDCGKVDAQGRPIPLLYYGLFVVCQRLWPQFYRWAAANGRGVLFPFYIHANHEVQAIQLAQRHHVPAEVIAILSDYAALRITNATQLLGWADDQN
jgi:hypothetical protein